MENIMQIEGYRIERLGEGAFSVSIADESLVPSVSVDAGVAVDGEPIYREELDYGSAPWPSDADVSAAVGTTVRFFDSGDNLGEAIYRAASDI